MILFVCFYHNEPDTEFSWVLVEYFQLFRDFSNRIQIMYPVWVNFLVISNFLGLLVLSDYDFLWDGLCSPSNVLNSFFNSIWRNKLRKLIFCQTGYAKYHRFGIWVKNAYNFQPSEAIQMKYGWSERAGIDVSENVYIH